MSKGKTNTLAQEIFDLLRKRSGNDWYITEAFLQIIDREKIMALNKYRESHGEPLIVPEPTRYKEVNVQNVGWIIAVPPSWISMTGREEVFHD